MAPSARERAGSARLDRLLVLVGVEFEARALRGHLRLPLSPDPRTAGALIIRPVGAGAGSLSRLRHDLEGLGVDAVLATGLAGGCAPGIPPGEIVVGSAVGTPSGSEWLVPPPRLLGRAVRALESASLTYRTGRLLTVDDVVATADAKADCWREQAAVAVDMESAHVMAWAGQVGLPALAVRVIADGPADTLPPALAGAIGPRGELRLSAVLGWAAHPTVVGAAWRVWRRSSVALDRLARFLTAFTRTSVEP